MWYSWAKYWWLAVCWRWNGLCLCERERDCKNKSRQLYNYLPRISYRKVERVREQKEIKTDLKKKRERHTNVQTSKSLISERQTDDIYIYISKILFTSFVESLKETFDTLSPGHKTQPPTPSLLPRTSTSLVCA